MRRAKEREEIALTVKPSEGKDTIAFVGALHISGINESLRRDGFRNTSIMQLQGCEPDED